MIQQFVKANQLSCLMDVNIVSERFPEPFRLQPNVQYCVTYEEYINYVMSLRADSTVKLTQRITTLVDMAQAEQMELYNCFLECMAVAIMKELHFAETYNCAGSVIIPVADTNPSLCSDLLSLHWKGASEQAPVFVQFCRKFCGYYIPTKFNPKNEHLFRLAMVLFRISKLLKFKGSELNLVYDL